MDDTAERICLPRLPAFKESTFCVDQADTDTVEYIRADLHQKALDRIEELETNVEWLREALRPFVVYVHDDLREGNMAYELRPTIINNNNLIVAGDFRNAKRAFAQTSAQEGEE